MSRWVLFGLVGHRCRCWSCDPVPCGFANSSWCQNFALGARNAEEFREAGLSTAGVASRGVGGFAHSLARVGWPMGSMQPTDSPGFPSHGENICGGSNGPSAGLAHTRAVRCCDQTSASPRTEPRQECSGRRSKCLEAETQGGAARTFKTSGPCRPLPIALPQAEAMVDSKATVWNRPKFQDRGRSFWVPAQPGYQRWNSPGAGADRSPS